MPSTQIGNQFNLINFVKYSHVKFDTPGVTGYTKNWEFENQPKCIKQHNTASETCSKTKEIHPNHFSFL